MTALEANLHYIFAAVRIRAAGYAMALGLPETEWRHVTDGKQIEGSRGTFHLLPGTDDFARHVANSNVQVTGFGNVIDHG